MHAKHEQIDAFFSFWNASQFFKLLSVLLTIIVIFSGVYWVGRLHARIERAEAFQPTFERQMREAKSTIHDLDARIYDLRETLYSKNKEILQLKETCK